MRQANKLCIAYAQNRELHLICICISHLFEYNSRHNPDGCSELKLIPNSMQWFNARLVAACCAVSVWVQAHAYTLEHIRTHTERERERQAYREKESAQESEGGVKEADGWCCMLLRLYFGCSHYAVSTDASHTADYFASLCFVWQQNLLRCYFNTTRFFMCFLFLWPFARLSTTGFCVHHYSRCIICTFSYTFRFESKNRLSYNFKMIFFLFSNITRI